MDLSLAVLGTGARRSLQSQIDGVVLKIGNDSFRRADLANVACFNYVAARRLGDVLSKLRAKDTADVFARISPRDLAVPDIGPIALAALGAAFELKKLGGESPLEKWASAHDEGHALVTFNTVKARVAHGREPKQKPKAKGVRRRRKA